jgi:predicted Fe-S protein YdhL (DUF1289 family)
MSTSNSNDPISGANSLLIGDAESDPPCIGICSTLYDEICKGCGRTLIEVSNWVFMKPEEKAAVWKRIQAEGTAMRFQRNKAD